MTEPQDDRRARHYAAYLALLPDMIGRLGWDRARIDAERDRALRDLVRHAKAHSPWHAARLAHVDPNDPAMRLTDIPVMSKAELMANWDGIVTVPGVTRAMAEHHAAHAIGQPYLIDGNVLMASGGTGGPPGLFLYDWTALATNFASLSRTMMLAAAEAFPGRRAFRLATVGVGASFHGSYVLGRIFSNPDNQTLAVSLWDSPERIVATLNAFQPDFVFATASFAGQLAAWQAAGLLRIAPGIFFFGSEHLPPASEATVRRTWPGVRVFTTWGTTEAAGTFPCRLEHGFHVSEDYVVIEPVDLRHEPCPPGTVSDGILLTNLANHAMPLLRYQIDDNFVMDPQPCACGSAYTRVAEVRGRAADRFRYGDLLIYAASIEVAALEQSGLHEYQVLQTAKGIHLRYTADAPADEAQMHARVLDNLTRCGLKDAEVRIEHAASLPRTANGKLKRFIPLGAAVPATAAAIPAGDVMGVRTSSPPADG